MNYVGWIICGALAGAGLGLLLPIAMVMLVQWSKRNDAHGLGTVAAIMVILTVPAGALAGIYLGAMRAKNGTWRGSLSATSDPQAITLFQALVLLKKFPNRRATMVGLPAEEAAAANRDYIANLRDMDDSIKPNVTLLVSWGLASLIFFPLAVVPLALLTKVLGTKWILQHLQQRAAQEWSEAAEEYDEQRDGASEARQ